MGFQRKKYQRNAATLVVESLESLVAAVTLVVLGHSHLLQKVCPVISYILGTKTKPGSPELRKHCRDVSWSPI